ncbi:MAG: beta-N-acetylhexosaminidase [Proteobacteria bacterium]|nr:glycoside hydrolase family 3 protein [Desulfobacula sp.]MBU4131905.1 beta-N-acetylhexosaminidase [Pseudomonadota bacterium]
MEKSDFPIEQMVGQRLMLGFDGTHLNQDLKFIIREIKAGGIVLFRPNIQSPDQLTRLCSDVQSYAADCGQPPLFIAVDQEGGVVARLKPPFTQFPGNPYIRTMADAEAFATVTAAELIIAGINMNMAPVLDVAPEGVDSIMKDRVFTGDAEIVSALGSAVIKTLQKGKVMAVAKHFPGIGRTTKDSHFFLPTLDTDLQTLKATDLRPFEAAMDANVAGIMLSHISYPQLDDTWQASLSPYIAGDLLRRQLGYQGLVLTDDLDMKAIKHDMKTCVRQVLASGIDLALICHKGPNIGIAWEEMGRLLDGNPLLFALARESMNRILQTKKRHLSV